jgi:GT2 family glycosyltransferase
MNALSIIIPSKTLSNLTACVGAVRESGETCRIIVVDDFDYSCGQGLPGLDWPSVEWTGGDKPFVFARNVNIGIRAAGSDDVLILNDDALLKTPGGFSLLQQAAAENPEYGIIAATTNNVGNPNQLPQGKGLRQDPRMVCFVAVLVPRRTIDKVGLLDERFIHYGLDDDDYSKRVLMAGLKIGIHDGCFVDHKSLKSTYRSPGGPGGNFIPNLRIFEEKWGMDNKGRPPGTVKG